MIIYYYKLLIIKFNNKNLKNIKYLLKRDGVNNLIKS